MWLRCLQTVLWYFVQLTWSRVLFFSNYRFSSKLIDLIRAMLKVDPKERPTIYRISDMLLKLWDWWICCYSVTMLWSFFSFNRFSNCLFHLFLLSVVVIVVVNFDYCGNFACNVMGRQERGRFFCYVVIHKFEKGDSRREEGAENDE